ncbi:MAG: glycosyltransferase family 4 protein [Candidatus Uhrbacteria bacterium]|nr:glycosyltransferase family 4 protein [Patescibacteria group bacterium]MBU1906833.1 glycosyltransferase family 4 protein [Patescibacteria group bacterium]
MKIAMIGQKTIGVKGERAGGIETHVEALSTRLVKRGNEVFVYARKDYHRGVNGNGKKFPQEYDGIKLVYIPTVYRKNLEAIVHTLLSTLHALFQPYDIIHYHGVGPATLSIIPRLLKRKCRVVVTFHSQDRFHQKWGFLARNYLHFGEWAAAWFPHACISVSHVIQVYCRKYYHRQVVYIPNGAQVQSVSSASEIARFGLRPDGYFLNVGRIVRHKGLHYLIEAYQQLDAPKGAKKKLVIVGSAAHTDDYLAEIKKRAAGDPNVLFLGFQSGEALRQLFAHAYTYVQPSESEGLAVVVLEAMSFGTPVLVSDIPENLEAMHHAGFSFHNKNVTDLHKQLQFTLDHSNDVAKAGKRSSQVINEFFNWDKITEHVEEVYRSVRH